MTRKIVYEEVDGKVEIKVEVNLILREVIVTESVGFRHHWYNLTYPQLFEMFPFMKDRIPKEDQ